MKQSDFQGRSRIHNPYFMWSLPNKARAAIKAMLKGVGYHGPDEGCPEHLLCFNLIKSGDPMNHVKIEWCCLTCGQTYSRTVRAPRVKEDCDGVWL